MILSPYERMIARRYLLPGKGEGIIAVVAGFSLGGVMLAVAALTIVMSVMNGFRADLIDKIVGLNGHAVIQGYGGRLPEWRPIIAAARRTPGITAAVPLIEQPLFVSYDGRSEGILVRGMRIADIRGNRTMTSGLKSGSLARLAPGAGEAAIGARLAEALGASVGSEITLISPQGRATPFGTVPRMVQVRVAAIFETGVYDYDNAFVVLPMEDAQSLLMLGDAVGMVEVQTADADRVGEILAPLAAQVRGIAVVQDWRQMNATLFDALAVERVAMFVVLFMIVLVAAFNILSALIMLVRAKTRDIAILRTMGASQRGMMKIFVAVGLTLGALGTIAGLLIAAVFLYFRQDVVDLLQHLTGRNLWDRSIRVLSELPSRTDPVDVALTVAMAMGLSLLFTLYPAWKAARTDPVQVLRYE